ncbi:uncharacterized protein E0L32_005448 [Thyridium curvatum]|uniref:Xylanolytic transcriptional activator regulatory domain-containing protein n=1 Tax=Thyridium curvatum TaxID=1093900 RepID=A0A507B763_9PEZI|nr:uncharacterized protein E0L32_005448 [Thyridium curvatum]TPX14484.1 hypothetical protein E0L32_005448 [Thyridium curvatum]
MRGDPDEDRQFRHPRKKSQNPLRRGGAAARPRREAIESPPLTLRPFSDQNEIMDVLPPFREIVDAVHYLIGHEFQLSFIPKAHLLLSLTGGRAPSAFLLLGILCLSARYTPSLAQRHGSPNAATEVYLAHAQSIAQDAIWGGPCLDKCQAFYFISKAQLYSGNKSGAHQSLGIAIRMALEMDLHREDTYRLTAPTKDLVIARESARRTFWMIYSQESLLSGPSSPGSLDPKYITALLPSSEYDFAEGWEPASRGALEGTAAVRKQSVHDPRRSLFATLLQATQLWVTISRWSLAEEGHTPSWEPESDHIRLAQKLDHWERTLHHEHQWSPALLRQYQKEKRDIAYTAIFMFTRICKILVRRPYLKKLMNPSPNTTEDWSQITKLFESTRELYELVDLQFSNRSCEGAGFMSDLSAFAVYTCGAMAVYLSNLPEVCPEPAIAREGPSMVRRTLAILDACQSIWPLAVVVLFVLRASLASGQADPARAVRVPAPATAATHGPPADAARLLLHRERLHPGTVLPSALVGRFRRCRRPPPPVSTPCVQSAAEPFAFLRRAGRHGDDAPAAPTTTPAAASFILHTAAGAHVVADPGQQRRLRARAAVLRQQQRSAGRDHPFLGQALF